MKKIFIANRGEVAVRIITTAKKLGISTVLSVSEADTSSYAASLADETISVGPIPAAASYLSIDNMLKAIKDSGADAVHPGSGFLSEKSDFARAVQEIGATWIGPDPEIIEMMGDKSAARKVAQEAGVPVIPGIEGTLTPDDDIVAIAEEIGYPLVVKASSGGGGRGIRLVTSPDNLISTVEITQAEAKASFGDARVYLERFIPQARHVEVQILGDGKDNYVHVGDRDCSLQRRHQKLVEEATAPDLPRSVREEIRNSSVKLARQCGYSGAGTVEFLYDPASHEAFFIEMNTRLQVEHPITEMLTGLDLVEEQIRIARGEGISFSQEELNFSGHAIEVRINAEDPHNNFMPSPGTINTLTFPSGEGIRVDSGVKEGSVVSPFYDSLLFKIIVHADSRDQAINTMLQALDNLSIKGVLTTSPMAQALISTTAFREVTHYSTFVEEHPEILEEL
ncbi:acetyl-CoA carboxylase biotin carboxylase subunit [Corynebacterium poyangense]|uniref:biotin carboxylase n=1 Tax=Corynebacterium poyangense TaxID=2684405 RepID=A0A7H0SRD3_9CORY|nr:acetyl-CoA carboxylase biotin carboxylase subunit [Corynebacterium poyangense]QNQ91108.1 acetyl-CoA carboxylase biotin carboxylase subunit [Corynebacterium poyangense]